MSPIVAALIGAATTAILAILNTYRNSRTQVAEEDAERGRGGDDDAHQRLHGGLLLVRLLSLAVSAGTADRARGGIKETGEAADAYLYEARCPGGRRWHPSVAAAAPAAAAPRDPQRRAAAGPGRPGNGGRPGRRAAAAGRGPAACRAPSSI
jgi:hypothetical protein